MHAPGFPKTFALAALTLAALTLATLLLAGCGGDDSPTAPGDDDSNSRRSIMVLSDGGTEDHVAATLTAAGFDVRDGGLFHEFAGAGLDGVDAVVLLTGVDYNNDMDDEGEWALTTFVEGGGGLLTTEWLSYSIERTGYHQVIQGILPVTYGGSYAAGTETYTVMVDHPVTENLPETFATGDDSQYAVISPRSSALPLIHGDRSGQAVATWTRGGRVVAWNMAGEYGGENVWNAEMDQLLVNAVDFVSEPRTGPTVDLEFDTISFEAWELTIVADGDGPAGSTNSPGDFFITVRLAADAAGEEVELARRDRVLVQAVDNEIVRPAIAVDARVPRVDGQRIVARISYYENDPDGPQQSAGAGMEFLYDAANGCWNRTVDEICVYPGGYITGDVFLEDYSGDPLNAELTWRLEVH